MVALAIMYAPQENWMCICSSSSPHTHPCRHTHGQTKCTSSCAHIMSADGCSRLCSSLMKLVVALDTVLYVLLGHIAVADV